MQLMTFRTEMESDNKNIPTLLKVLSVQLKVQRNVSDKLVNSYKMGVFTIEVPEQYSIESFRDLMRSIIENDERFVDMHRCHQTLNIGLEPDNKWYTNALIRAGIDINHIKK